MLNKTAGYTTFQHWRRFTLSSHMIFSEALLCM